MKRFIIVFLSSVITAAVLILAVSFYEILRCRNRKTLTIWKMENQKFELKVPVEFCRSAHGNAPFVPVWTDDGHYGMRRDEKSGKIFFRTGKSLSFGVFSVTYEVSDPVSAKQLSEIFRTKGDSRRLPVAETAGNEPSVKR